MSDFSSPTQRAFLAETLGPAEYNRQFKAWLDAQALETVGGHVLRYVDTRFGRLVAVGDTGTAFYELEQARQHALANPKVARG